jgi:hypothetical protein
LPVASLFEVNTVVINVVVVSFLVFVLRHGVAPPDRLAAGAVSDLSVVIIFET